MDLKIRTAAPAPPAASSRPMPSAAKPAAMPAAMPASAGGNGPPATGKGLPAAAAAVPPADALAGALARVQEFLQGTRRELEFQVHEASGRTVLRVLNPSSGEVIRQVPAEEVLAVAAAIEAGRQGLLDQLG